MATHFDRRQNRWRNPPPESPMPTTIADLHARLASALAYFRHGSDPTPACLGDTPVTTIPIAPLRVPPPAAPLPPDIPVPPGATVRPLHGGYPGKAAARREVDRHARAQLVAAKRSLADRTVTAPTEPFTPGDIAGMPNPYTVADFDRDQETMGLASHAAGFRFTDAHVEAASQLTDHVPDGATAFTGKRATGVVLDDDVPLDEHWLLDSETASLWRTNPNAPVRIENLLLSDADGEPDPIGDIRERIHRQRMDYANRTGILPGLTCGGVEIEPPRVLDAHLARTLREGSSTMRVEPRIASKRHELLLTLHQAGQRARLRAQRTDDPVDVEHAIELGVAYIAAQQLITAARNVLVANLSSDELALKRAVVELERAVSNTEGGR